ncbi:ADP-ribosylation factor-like protein 13B isoform X2 [Macrosteles quadrilineatus]|nr:ADP-ribosylation factor-like protein 13B isoform X2 [Macrosteles quadrilineatus]
MLVGLDNAGKSSTAKRLAGEPVDSIVPTVGFSSVKLKHRGYSVVIYDLGGSPQIRGIWHRYFVDVHGVIYVVDASDMSRIEESRKALHELLAHEKLAGKPLLLLANKQDQDGALDEIDIVERLNVEALVNQQKCPTLVETCSTTGAPHGRKPHVDPGILSGYRWLLRRIINEYDKLNARVEQDLEEQRVANEVARQDWLRRQDTDLQADSLPSDNEITHDPFQPINTLVEHNGYTSVNGHVATNGHVTALKPLTPSDSPDSSSHTVEGEYIPLHSPVPSPPPPAEPNILVISEPQPIDIVMAVKDQFEWKMNEQKRRNKKLLLRRTNRTAPTSASSEPGRGHKELPPLKVAQSCPWARPVTAKSLPSQGWGLTMSLEEMPPVTTTANKLSLQVLSTPKQLMSSDSDDEDVVIYTPHS